MEGLEVTDEGEKTASTLLEFLTDVCASAAKSGNGLILAIEDGYAMQPHPASDVFLRVDAEAAHNPQSTFRNGQLSALLDDAVLPIMGVLNPEVDDSESWALKTGYARDRVVGYQKVKAATLGARSVGADEAARNECEATAAAVRKDLYDCEENVMHRVGWQPSATGYTEAKRQAWNARGVPDRAPSLMDNVQATGITRAQIVGMYTGKWEDEGNAARDQKLGTERFIAFAFAPDDHEALVAANATGGGVHGPNGLMAYPAYVTVHNSKGAIDTLPATATESRPNSVIVPCAASLICELHALSAKAGRNHVLIAHQV